jgi:hypothetical protein
MKSITEIKQEKVDAYKRAMEMAIAALEFNNPLAFEEILQAWQEYELLALEEEAYLKKYMPDKYNMLYVVMTSKNIKDRYWNLPQATKVAWDNNPKLKSWIDQYR